MQILLHLLAFELQVRLLPGSHVGRTGNQNSAPVSESGSAKSAKTVLPRKSEGLHSPTRTVRAPSSKSSSSGGSTVLRAGPVDPIEGLSLQSAIDIEPASLSTLLAGLDSAGHDDETPWDVQRWLYDPLTAGPLGVAPQTTSSGLNEHFGSLLDQLDPTARNIRADSTRNSRDWPASSSSRETVISRSRGWPRNTRTAEEEERQWYGADEWSREMLAAFQESDQESDNTKQEYEAFDGAGPAEVAGGQRFRSTSSSSSSSASKTDSEYFRLKRAAPRASTDEALSRETKKPKHFPSRV